MGLFWRKYLAGRANEMPVEGREKKKCFPWPGETESVRFFFFLERFAAMELRHVYRDIEQSQW